MSTMLSYLDNYSDRISHQILNAQLQVIQCFQTPELVDSAVDTILFNLQKALQDSQTNEEAALVKEQFAFIIQNLVSFLELKARMAIADYDSSAENAIISCFDTLHNQFKTVAVLSAVGIKSAIKLVGTSITSFSAIAAASAPLIISQNSIKQVADSAIGAVSALGAEKTESIKGIESISNSSNEAIRNTYESSKDVTNHLVDSVILSNKEVFSDASNGLLQDVINVIDNSTFLSDIKNSRNNAIKNFFKLIHKKELINKTEISFKDSVTYILKKLCKYRDLIGPSIIVSGVVHRYLKTVEQYMLNPIIEKRKKSEKEYEDATRELMIKHRVITPGNRLKIWKVDYSTPDQVNRIPTWVWLIPVVFVCISAIVSFVLWNISKIPLGISVILLLTYAIGVVVKYLIRKRELREYQLELNALNDTFTKLFEQIDMEEASIKNEVSQLHIESRDFDE